MSARTRTAVPVVGATLVFCLFAALGTWQLHRRAWKLELIARVEQRVHAPATPAPRSAEWPGITPQRDEYRHVRATGTFLHESETLVFAVTVLGSGFWVLTPLRLDDGTIVLVNRGFVPEDRRKAVEHAVGESSNPLIVTGLMRMPEPGGAFLRHNDSPRDRWYSRDVAAIAAARGLGPVAPYFIDSEADGGSDIDGLPAGGPTASASLAAPVGGLTVVSFNNNHLVYALTWYALALMTVGAAWRWIRDGRR